MKKSKKERQKQTKPARDERKKEANLNDEILENKIQEIPGLTYVQLEKVFSKNKFQFKKSYLRNALDRLEKKAKTILGSYSISRDGKIVKKYYPTFSKKNLLGKKIEELKIPNELLELNGWTKTCIMYGIKSNELLIAPKKLKDLEDTAFYKKELLCEKTLEKLIIKIPRTISDYYDLTINNMDLIYENNCISIRITPLFNKELSKDKFNILILEDNLFWSDIFRNKFTDAGHFVFPFSSIKTAEEISKNQKFDWIVLDDEINHRREAKKFFLKLKKINPKINGIFITSYSITEKRREELLELGFKSIIEKKIDRKNRDPEEIAAEQLVRIEA